MLLLNLRNELIETCLKLTKLQLLGIVSTGGNVSYRDNETGYIGITPSGMSYGNIKPEDIVIVDEDGKIFDGKRKPSIETPMHTGILKERRDINAVIHTHSLYATAYATLRKEMPVVTTELAMLLGLSVPVGDYGVPGSKELAMNMCSCLGKNGKVALLASHGALALGTDLSNALLLAHSLEEATKIYFTAVSMGKPAFITPEMVKELMVVAETYGQ